MATKIHVVFFAGMNNENIFPCLQFKKDDTSRQFLWEDWNGSKIMNHCLMFADQLRLVFELFQEVFLSFKLLQNYVPSIGVALHKVG
jgi:hypothetical protein